MQGAFRDALAAVLAASFLGCAAADQATNGDRSHPNTSSTPHNRKLATCGIRMTISWTHTTPCDSPRPQTSYRGDRASRIT